MAWNKKRVAAIRDTTYDRESFDETLVALAGAIHALTYPTQMLLPASVDQLIEALKIDYKNSGFFDPGTFACGICLANGTNYEPWSDEALEWLKVNGHELEITQFVGRHEQHLNLCSECAKRISGMLWDLPGSWRASPPSFDIFA